jgi:hypothetical protein
MLFEISLDLAMLGALLLVWAPGLALAAWFSSWNDAAALRIALVPIGSGLAGSLLFWAWFFGPQIGQATSVTVGVLSLGALLLSARRLDREILLPTLLATAICLFYFGLLGLHGQLLQGARMAADRFWATGDNFIPRMFSDALMKGRAAILEPFWGWRFSDRPPLQTGMIMVAYPFAPKVYAEFAYLCLAIAANGLWVFGLWSFLRLFALSERTIAVAIIAVAATGAFYVNNVFTWPKLLAGALTLTAAASLYDRRAAAGSRALGAGTSAALAMLAHGAAVYGLIGIALAGLADIRGLGIKRCALAVLTALILYAPWIGFQKFVDPPGDHLLKWQLAGAELGQETNATAGQVILKAYREAGIARIAENKLNNLRMLVGDPTIFSFFHPWQPRWVGTPLNKVRSYLDTRLAGAPGLLLIGVVTLLFTRRLRTEAWAHRVAWILLWSSITYAMIEFGTDSSTTWLIAAPYSLLLLWCALGAIALARLSKPWATAILMAHILTFYTLWVYGVPDAWIQVAPSDIPSRAGTTSAATVIFSLVLLIAAAHLSQEKP